MRLFPILATVLLVASPVLVARAGDGCGDSKCGVGVHCPRCHGTCELSVSKEEVKKSCWDVECKTICIPRITFPWQKCGDCGSCCGGKCGLGKSGGKGADPDCNLDCVKSGGAQACGAARCARAKTVRTLKKVEYTCGHCKYKWTPSDDKGCDGCKDKADEGVSEESPEVAPPPPPVSARQIYGKPLVERTAARSE
jgi:hypothetical protein